MVRYVGPHTECERVRSERLLSEFAETVRFSSGLYYQGWMDQARQAVRAGNLGFEDREEFYRLNKRGDTLLKEALKDAMCDHSVSRDLPITDQAAKQLKLVQGKAAFGAKLEDYCKEISAWHDKVKEQIEGLPLDTPVAFGTMHFVNDATSRSHGVIARDDEARENAQRESASSPQGVSARRTAGEQFRQ